MLVSSRTDVYHVLAGDYLATAVLNDLKNRGRAGQSCMLCPQPILYAT